MDEKKIFSYVNFAKKSNEILYGIDNIKASKRAVSCIILSNNASQNLKDSIDRYCISKNVPCIHISNATIDEYLHTTNCKVIGILNPNISKQIVYLYNVEE